jgi:DNA-3-methyladenine glycosylase II
MKPILFSSRSFDSKRACRELTKQDPKLGKLIKKIGPFELKIKSKVSPFEYLVRSIIFQQLHGKAAATIHGRVLKIFGDRQPTPLELMQTDGKLLRAAGCSGNKTLALKDLARAAHEGQVPDRKRLAKMSDQEIIDALVPIRGVGRWTVEMLLIFGIGRADVLAVDDFALKKSAMILHGKKDLTRKEFQKLGERWAPYRSLASWYLWRALD